MKKKCETTVWSRVCGFFRPVQAWNLGAKSQFDDRKVYNIGGKDDTEKNKEDRSS